MSFKIYALDYNLSFEKYNWLTLIDLMLYAKVKNLSFTFFLTLFKIIKFLLLRFTLFYKIKISLVNELKLVI